MYHILLYAKIKKRAKKNQPKSNLFAGISDTLKKNRSKSVVDKSPRANPSSFFIFPDRVTTKKATLLGGIVVTLSGLEPEFAP